MIFFGSLIEQTNSVFDEMSETSKQTILDNFGSLDDLKYEVCLKF